MKYLYHAVPYNMKGTVLYPLNQLQHIDMTLYKAHVEKYADRKWLQQRRIPLLGNCLWNDVLFLTAVHPSQFRKAFEAAGYTRHQPFRAFEFKLDSFDMSRMAVITKMPIKKPMECELFDPSSYDRYAVIPKETTDYWREELEAGQRRPFLYLHIPHIIYRNTLDTTLASIVES